MAFNFPDPNVTPEFTGNNGITYSWDAVDGKWQIKRYGADFDDRYVNEEGGDSMEGQLIINGPRKAGDDVDKPNLVSSVKVLSIDNAQNSSLQLRHSGNAKVYIGDTDISIASDIKFNRAAGAVVKTNVQDLFNISEREIAYVGQSIEDEDLITKKYVDDARDFLQNEIIELEEEINAIAPSVEYGRWKYQEPGGGNTVRPPEPGTFYMVSAFAMVTDQYEEAVIIKIHNDEFVAPGDTDPVDNHTWAEADIGKLIQLFDAADPDFFLGKITDKNVDTNGDFVTFTVDRIQSSGVPNDNADPVTGEYLSRINIFEEPSGGNASEFVQKKGDTMTGDLAIDQGSGTGTEATLKLTGSRTNTDNSSATIAFGNSQSPTFGYLTYRSYGGTSFFKFNQNLDLNTKTLSGVDHIELKNGGFIGSGDKPRIRVRNGGGSNNQAGTDIQRPGDGMRTFAIKGKPAGSSNVEDFFWSYGNTGNGGDAINYTGLTTAANHIATKKYVDSKAGVDIDCSTSGRSKGDMWYCSSDSTLYIKVS